ncbi:Cof-type HAD-IIB family hydrolase [Ammoniphilus sp. YIM 78166]|uniref:Cof-type HAD-IIB family hydrolase n=1 Tax=Ammoniphilus sp. YIM 78166 TaxID=1644106 RepID=UPI00106FAAE8|nr:Cof-type HAD-IIB family hydrolase [Ammoniphilus sp. YIM 78166]
MIQDLKLIALDIDGTLLNDRGVIPEENHQAIQLAKQKGIHVVLSTGRSIITCREYAKSLQLDSYLVTSNGAEVWDNKGNLLQQHILTASLVGQMYEMAQAYETRFWAISTDRIWSGEMPEDIFSRHWLKFGFELDTMQKKEKIASLLADTGELEITSSTPMNLEINTRGVHKARGLQYVCEQLGIGMKQVIAMGDSLNDLEMIKAVGCGIAMGNAQEELKRAADWITDTNEEAGVANAIKHWVL